MVLDMFCHWNYVFEHLFGRVDAVIAKAVTHIPERWDEQGRPYAATADDAAYGIFELGDTIVQMNSSWAVRVDRDELVEFQVDGTHGSAVAGLFGCRIQPRVRTPKPVWNPDLPTDQDFRASGTRSRTTRSSTTASAPQWEQFLTDVDAGGRIPTTSCRRSVASSWSRPGCLVGRRATGRAGESDAMTAIELPNPDGTLAVRRAGRARRLGRPPAAATAAGSPSRRHTSPPTRSRTTCPARRPPSTGTPPWRSARAVPLRLRGGRGDGHRAAQHGPGLAGRPGAGAPQRRAGRRAGARIASGAGTDHRTTLDTVEEVIAAYPEQVAFVESTGSQVILMASRHLAAVAGGAEDYLKVYDRILAQVSSPVILHWLGEVFDPQLRGYWGSADVDPATNTFLELVREHAAKVDGVKVSLLSAEHETGLRAGCRTASASTPATTSTTPS